MRSSTSPFLSALAAALILAASSPAAWAQACCAGASTLTATQLTSSESSAVGLRLRVSSLLGSFDAEGGWASSPARTSEEDLGEDLFAVMRLKQRFQVGLVVPFVETFRALPGVSDGGGGLGDLQLSGRWDLTTADDSEEWPGVTLLAGVSAPTGRAAESATHPLATDATGLGSATGLAGLQLEKASGHLLFDLLATVVGQFNRTANGVTQAYGADATVAFAAGWAFDSGPGLALVGTFRHQGEATLNGRTVPGSALSLVTVGLSGGMYVADSWRLQGSLSTPLPLTDGGFNTPAAPGLQLSVIRSWM